MRALVLIIILLFGTTAVGQQLKEITNSIGMKLVLIHPGSFTMGSPVGEVGRKVSESEHEVTISKSYYLGVYEVNQDEYEKVLGNNPSISKGANNPVQPESWFGAVSFCTKLSELPEEKAAGREFRLPTEAEWEYACRATSSAAYFFGDTAELLEEYAWFGERRGKTHPVGSKKPNRWGLYDMHGNVLEWCQDWYGHSSLGEATDPQGPREGRHRVYRGGSWNNDAGSCQSAFRAAAAPSYRNNNHGFRVAMSLPSKQPETAPSK